MCNFDKNFQVNLDYWIYNSGKQSKAETIENLQKILRYGVNEPNQVLLDVARSLQKLEAMPEEEFEENNDLFPFQRKYLEQVEIYAEGLQMAREFDYLEKVKWYD